MNFDINGNPDVMGSVPMSAQQADAALNIRLEFNKLHTMLHGNPGSTPEALRLYAVARTQTELACMAAVKAVSRDT